MEQFWLKAKRGVARAEEAKLNLWQICPHPQDWRGVRKVMKKMRTLTSVRCRRRKFHFIIFIFFFKEGLKHQDGRKKKKTKTGAKDRLVNTLCPTSQTGRGRSLTIYKTTLLFNTEDRTHNFQMSHWRILWGSISIIPSNVFLGLLDFTLKCLSEKKKIT